MNAKPLLILSLVLNIVCGAILAAILFTGPDDTPDRSGAGANGEIPLGQAEGNTQQIITNTVIKQMTWETVEAPDYLEYIENLRSIGCPEETIRDIILADVNKLYKTKRREVSDTKEFEFWKASSMFSMGLDRENADAMKALDNEREDLLKQLGIESDLESTVSQLINPLEQMFNFLPEKKQVAVMKAMQDMQSRMAELSEDGNLDGEMVTKAQREMEDSIKGLLSDEEYTNYLLRMSNTANTMRTQIAGFDPSKEEFLEVFNLRRQFDEEYGSFFNPNSSDTDRDAYNAAKDVMNEQIREALGDERYADYERAQDYKFQSIHRAMKQADLGTDQAVQVYDIQLAAEESVGELRSNRRIESDERESLLQEIRQETESAIQQAIGANGWEKYNKRQNTYWLENIHRTENPPNAENPADAVVIPGP